MTDAPLIVLLPGLDGTGRMFGPFARELAAEYDVRVLRYPTDTFLGYEALTDFVRAALPVDRSCVIVAESFSGPIGCALAAQGAPGLAGLVLCASFSGSPLPWLRPFAAPLRHAPVRAVPLRLLSWLLLGRWATPALLAELRLALAEVDPSVLQRRAHAAMTAAAVAFPPSANVPLLYLQASLDRLVRPGAAQRLRAGFPQVEVVGVPGPHFLLQAEPVHCAELVSEFVRRIDTSVHRATGSSATQPATPPPVWPENPAARTTNRP